MCVCVGGGGVHIPRSDTAIRLHLDLHVCQVRHFGKDFLFKLVTGHDT